MKEMNYPPFYVGQKVVQLVDGHYTKSKKGDVFIVLGIKKECCSWLIDVGFKAVSTYVRCQSCGHSLVVTDNIHWVMTKYYHPIESTFQEITYEKVMEEESKFVTAN